MWDFMRMRLVTGAASGCLACFVFCFVKCSSACFPCPAAFESAGRQSGRQTDIINGKQVVINIIRVFLVFVYCYYGDVACLARFSHVFLFAIHSFIFFFLNVLERGRGPPDSLGQVGLSSRGTLVAWFLDLIHASSLRLHVKIACDGQGCVWTLTGFAVGGGGWDGTFFEPTIGLARSAAFFTTGIRHIAAMGVFFFCSSVYSRYIFRRTRTYIYGSTIFFLARCPPAFCFWYYYS